MKTNKERVYLKVGFDGDIQGEDNRALQAAVDYVANLGGGIVEISSGTFTMRNSLHLRSNVTLRGQGKDTVLKKDDGVSSQLFLDGDHGEEAFTPVNPQFFSVGMGVSVFDDRSKGFGVSTATIIGRDGDMFQINNPLSADYLVKFNAQVTNSFSVIRGENLANVKLESLVVDGNKAENELLAGCRGGGVYLYNCHNVAILNCNIKNYNGDGISFQKCNDVLVDNCFVLENTWFGIHPGSGSQRPIIRNCVSKKNGKIGLFICWRVKNGVFENNEINWNGESGISIGHKDTDNQIKNNVIQNNGICGIHFREELMQMAPHRNLIVGNYIMDNGKQQNGYGIKMDSEVYHKCRKTPL